MSDDKIRADLALYKFSDTLDAVSRYFSIKPTASWNKGDKTPGGLMVRKNNGWYLSSRIHDNCAADEHITDIREQLSQVGRDSVAIPFVAEILISVYMEISPGQMPPMRVSNANILFMANIGAFLDVDIYLNVE